MGLRTDKAIKQYGADCPFCTGDPYNLFEPGKTPSILYVYFWDIYACYPRGLEAPQGYALRLEQHPTYPCRYTNTFYSRLYTWQVAFNFYHIPAGLSWLTMNRDLQYNYFSGFHVYCCKEYAVFLNDFEMCGGDVEGIGGAGVVTWNKKVREVIDYFGLDVSPELFFDFFPVSNQIGVVRLVRERDHTNVKIKFET